ncbi:guanylate kinase [Aliifodinibius salicampi]|uniref:Guanylate kinase n=1 Tax=Fodinibius salicampi TaxID=1920655 RepID=A0ABT3PY96_9BACT|nr:guanylate kinase [Fodinibius salicampi]MCW9712798.1 guanylate kinase [Fodinibius salicampi]
MNNTTNRGKVIIIVAPSGAGKTTLAKRLLKEHPSIRFSVSATTRPPREGEKNGEDYYFLTDEEFKRRIKKGHFLEWETYNGNRYGTLQSEVDKLVESGYFPLLDIEVKGALNVQKIYGSDAISIFIEPPSLEVLKNRLLNRGSETDASIKRRLERAEMEIEYAEDFDYTVTNDDLDTAYAEIQAIIEPFITD